MCKSCQALMINHVLCHESGCPDSWKDKERDCNWCGSKFVPESKDDKFCDNSCYCAYNSLVIDEQ